MYMLKNDILIPFQILSVLEVVDDVAETDSLPLVQAWMAMGEAILSGCCKR